MTEQEIKAIEDWAQAQTSAGLVLENSDTGEANGAILRAFISNNRLPYNVESLSVAARMAKGLTWAEGCAPGEAEAKAAAVLAAKEAAVQARRKRDGIDTIGVGRDGRESQADRDANIIARAKANAAQQASVDARAKQASDAVLREKEENIKIFDDSTGRINHGATEAARRSAREKWAKIQGRTLAPRTIREIDMDQPMTKAELSKFTLEEIQRAIAKQKRGRGY